MVVTPLLCAFMCSSTMTTRSRVGVYITLALDRISDVVVAINDVSLGKLVLYLRGSRKRGVQRDSLASLHHVTHHGGYIPQVPRFSHFRSYGATHEPASSWLATAVSWFSFGSAGYFHGRTWGWLN
ncbi:hypothetical protein BS17DRAFT_807499 [Gyrodon lividus]|nr:hypothetical protein BS17DRAFT_807499 [Gyrodon lividus]